MNALSDTVIILFSQIFTAALLILVMSYGAGLIMGGPQKANKIIGWELKKLRTFCLWILKNILQAIANLFSAGAKACGPQKKKKKKPA